MDDLGRKKDLAEHQPHFGLASRRTDRTGQAEKPKRTRSTSSFQASVQVPPPKVRTIGRSTGLANRTERGEATNGAPGLTRSI